MKDLGTADKTWTKYSNLQRRPRPQNKLTTLGNLLKYYCSAHRISGLRIKNCDLTPTHACIPISHAWSKSLSHYSLNRLILKKILRI